MSNTMQKLASGFRINRAGDDAAGLAISEKMRGQIRGLHMAQKNASDGMSMLQVAEGALQETHAMLQRLRELSVQAANDTHTEDDHALLQQEVTSLLAQIDKHAHDTQFNTQPLLNGNYLTSDKGYTLQVGANSGQHMHMNVTGNATLEGLGLQLKAVDVPAQIIHHDISLVIKNQYVANRAIKQNLHYVAETDRVQLIPTYTTTPQNSIASMHAKDENNHYIIISGESLMIDKAAYEAIQAFDAKIEQITNPNQSELEKEFKNTLQAEIDHLNAELQKLNTPKINFYLDINMHVC